MPVFYNDGLDDQLAYDLTGSFIGGQVSNVRANLLKEAQFSEGKNMDISRFGALTTRRGTELNFSNLSTSIKGLTFFDTPSHEKVIASTGGNLYAVSSSGGAWSTIGTGFNSTNNIEFAQLVDKTYLTDNASNLYSYNGSGMTDEGSAMPTSKYLISHTNRLFSANTSNYDDEVAASDILDGSTWPSGFQFRVGGGEGDPITGITSWYNFNLLVFKERSIHVISTDPSQSSASNWSVHKIDNSIGCLSNKTIAQVGADVFFLARDGVRTVRTILSGAQSAISEPISIPIDDYIKRINWEESEACCAKFWDNRYILSVPLDNSSTANYTLVFNTVTKSWSGYWTGWNPTVFSESKFGAFPKMIFGDSSGNVLTWLDYVNENSETSSTYQDNGVDIESMVKSRGHVFGDFLSTKLGNHVDLELKNSVAGCHCAELYADFDQGAGASDVLIAENLSTMISTVSLNQTLPFTLPSVGPFSKSYSLSTKGEFDEIQFTVKSSSGYLHLRSIKASAYLNPMKMEK